MSLERITDLKINIMRAWEEETRRKKEPKKIKMEEIRRRKGNHSWRSGNISHRREDKPNIDREEDLYCC